ncbi:DsbA family oxidoreductase [Kocuria dechangensis]|uniref:DsbA family oxidoreductase n=1 Tax=Kocuria dechangensis TaxID=1176249 RepID=UPI001E6506D8|nr:DsbA family oxidoreductase [Kocuria dechangensis]
MTLQIDIWSDIACPWCLIGKRRFDRALAAFPHRDQVSVTYRSFQLDPSLPESWNGRETDYLAQVKGLDPEQVRQMLAQVSTVAAEEGLHYDFDALVVANSLKAHRLLHAARRADGGAAGASVAARLKEALLTGHFERGLDIGDDDALAALAVEAGLPEAAAREALTDPALDRAVQEDVAAARRLGIQGVPFYVLDGRYGISGAQPTEAFEQALEQVWAETHPLVGLGGAAPACGPEGCDV